MMRKTICAALAAGSLITTYANASDNIAEGVYLAPGIHYQSFGGNIFDQSWSLEEKGGLNLGLGYQWASGWALELAYHHTETDIKDTKIEAKTNYTHLDVLYHFGNIDDTRWSPYLVGGIGQQTFDIASGKENDEQINLGVGLKYGFTNKFFFRSDIRSTIGVDDADAGALFNMGLVYIFGGDKPSSAKDKARKAVAEERAEEPAVVTQSEPVPVVAPVVVDSDGDGVPDDRDACNNTESGAKVDERGCYMPLTQAREFTLRVNFASGSSEVNAASRDGLRELADFLREYPNTNVVIEGHSDSTGNAASNKRLSQQRADAVKYSLINDYDIQADRVNSIGWGIEKPIADNGTAEGRAKNRRVVARVTDK